MRELNVEPQATPFSREKGLHLHNRVPFTLCIQTGILEAGRGQLLEEDRGS